jgi:hypothetical protein
MKIAGKRDPAYLARKRARDEAFGAFMDARYANTKTIEELEHFGEFEYPRGTGWTWTVDPLPFTIGARITECEIELTAIHRELMAYAERQKKQKADGGDPGPDTNLMQRLASQWESVVSRAASIADPLLIPTTKGRRRYRVLKPLGLWTGPLKRHGATANEVAWVVGFLAQCQMTYGLRAGYLARPAKRN